MVTLPQVIEIGREFPISTDPDFLQEAHLIRLMTRTERGTRKAWKEACRRYGYSDQIQPLPEEAQEQELRAFSRRKFFKPSAYRRKKFWEQVEAVLLPAEKAILWKWARNGEELITPEIRGVIDTVIVMTMPVLA